MAYSNDIKDFPDGWYESLSPAQRILFDDGVEFATPEEYADDEPAIVVVRPKGTR